MGDERAETYLRLRAEAEFRRLRAEAEFRRLRARPSSGGAATAITDGGDRVRLAGWTPVATRRVRALVPVRDGHAITDT